MIKFTTINVDGKEVAREFESVWEIKKDWYSDSCTLPMLDDEVIYAEVDGKRIEAKIFEDVVHAVGVC